MKRRRQVVSPAQFSDLQRALLLAEIEGHGPEESIRRACRAVNIEPPTSTQLVDLFIDYGEDQPCLSSTPPP